MTKTRTEAKLLAWGCAEVQHYRGRGAIVMRDQAVLESVPMPTIPALIPGCAVCRVAVPVILESREQGVSYCYFSNTEIARICG